MAKQQYLVALDNTEEADEVLAAARKLADATQADLYCITVIRPFLQTYGQLDIAGYAQNTVELENQAVAQAEQRLAALATEYGVDAAATYVKLGNPAFEIRALAGELSVDLIVIGTHGRHGLGLLLGSTANAVLHGIGCDAYVVKVH